jgi:lysophospholipase L1-like esterase
MAELAADQDVLFVDGTAAVRAAGRPVPSYFSDRVHPNADGARVLALALDRALGSEPP